MSIVTKKYEKKYKIEESNSVNLLCCNEDAEKELSEKSINILPLSVRLKNICKANKIYTIKNFLNVENSEWLKFHDFGKKSLEEVFDIKYLIDSMIKKNKTEQNINEKYGKNNDKNWQDYIISKEEIMNLPVNLFDVSARLNNILISYNINTLGKFLNIEDDDWLSIPNFGKKSLKEISDIKNIVYCSEQLNTIIEKIKGSKNLDEFFRDLDGFAKRLPDDIQKSVYKLRIKSSTQSTLQYLADTFGITRERIRQIETKIIDKLLGIFLLHLKSFENLFEKYGPIIKFDIINEFKGHEDFFGIFINIKDKLPFKVHTENKILCDNKFDIDSFNIDTAEDVTEGIIEGLINDYLESVIKPFGDCTGNFNAIKVYFLSKFLNNKFVFFERRRVPANKFSIIKIFFQKHCRDTIEFSVFFDLYKKTMLENGFFGNKKLVFDEDTLLRTMMPNRKDILWTTGRQIRYYNTDKSEELIKQLDFHQYKNKEISSKKIFLDYLDLMKDYDVRNEYELHNLLKKTLNNKNIEFGRMPTIYFGKCDREKQIKKFLSDMAPISAQDLAEAYKEAYGVEPSIFHANYIQYISEYQKNGIYDVAPLIMPDSHIYALKKELTKDFYWINEFEKIYTELFEHVNLSLINSYNLAKLGYNIASTYIFSNRFKSFDSYIRNWIENNKIINMQDNRAFRSLVAFNAIISEMKKNLDLIEFQKDKYIKTKHLSEASVTKEDLYSFIKKVKESMLDRYFTIQYLRDEEFSDKKLEELGFDDFFYASILSSDNSFQMKRVNGVYLIKHDSNHINISEFLTFIMGSLRRIDMYDFIDYLFEKYGLLFDRYSIVAYIKESDLYYNEIMDKIYINYDEFFNSEV